MIVDVYADRKAREVQVDTWGHLAPVPRHPYRGFVLFCVTPMGDHLLLDFDFEGLDGNPWTLEHVSEWWDEETRKPSYDVTDKVQVWRWTGTYLVKKSGAATFSGSVSPMSLSPSTQEKNHG